ncbi:MAG: DUF5320 domain-containing protein [Synergistales bacterium]|nr:DUF5320 domain-containing protein [Synergistales bacterium]
MPGFDGRGPWGGYGPGSGRGLGPCGAGRRYNPYGRRFLRRGWRGGPWCYDPGYEPYYEPYPYPASRPTTEEEKAVLQEQLDYLQTNMEEIKARLKELQESE